MLSAHKAHLPGGERLPVDPAEEGVRLHGGGARGAGPQAPPRILLQQRLDQRLGLARQVACQDIRQDSTAALARHLVERSVAASLVVWLAPGQAARLPADERHHQLASVIRAFAVLVRALPRLAVLVLHLPGLTASTSCAQAQLLNSC